MATAFGPPVPDVALADDITAPPHITDRAGTRLG
jgi:hypothetical protein